MVEKRRYKLLLSTLILCIILLVIVSISLGRYSMTPKDVIMCFVERCKGNIYDEKMDSIVFFVRLPRIVASLLIGGALSLSGATYQSTFRNPLISPDLLGVSAGATVGAAIGIILGIGFYQLQVFAFLGGIFAVFLATMLTKILKDRSNMMLVLSGIIVSGLMSSVLGVIKFMASEETDLASIVFWQMGSLATIKVEQLVVVTPIIILCTIALILVSWRLNILSLGEDEALIVGINIPRLRAIAVICASLLTACSVSISGTIGWIGLVIPHFSRLLVGSDNTKLFPITVLMGGMFLLIIDTMARTLTSAEIPLSILSGLLGTPMYAWLLYRQGLRRV